MKAQKHTSEQGRNAQKMHSPAPETSGKKKVKHPKTHAKYWESRVSKPSGTGIFWVQITHEKKRHRFPLDSSEREPAAETARKIYLSLVAAGWPATLEKFDPKAAPAAEAAPSGTTVGQYVEEVRKLSTTRAATLRACIASFRRIAADVAEVNGSASRYAATGKGREAWLSKVDAVPLEEVTPAKVEAWKLAYVATHAGGDEIKARAARNSANSILRQAKACFNKRLVRFLADKLALPRKLPFDGVEFFERQSMRYKGGVDIAGVIAKANKELASKDTEAFKAFLLGLFAGLRRNEIDKLRWNSIDFQNNLVRVEVMPDFAPKAETSLGEIPIEPQVSQLLEGLRAADPSAVYVLAGAASKLGASWSDYRAAGTFERLTAWLRLAGLETRAPLHQLRKEAGSLVCKAAGLFAASRFLRHADVQITAMHYVEHRNAATVGLGAFLTPPPPPPGNVIAGQFEAPQTTPKRKGRAGA